MRPSVIARDGRLSGAPSTRGSSEAQDEVNLGTVDPKRPGVGSPVRRRRTWTHISTEGRSKSVHAVEFSKTVAPLRKGSPSEGARSDPADTEADR
jgi:hypothetical protein